MAQVSRDTPLSELTLRKYEKPSHMPERQVVKKICLSLGVLQPGDSRDVIVDILHVLLKGRKRKKLLTAKQIEDAVIKQRKRAKLELLGIASSNIRRQIRRLKEIMLVEKVNNGYRIAEFMPLAEIYEKKIEKFYLSSISERIKEYLAIVK
ncbi:hypothetical protein HYV81_02995 [Candidatus Woesearchaeota archaeon]|nr:hypothetical protein [Candidatus Woesearchaeota archaeon]